MLTIMLLIDVVTMVNIYGYNGYCGCCGYYDGVIVTYHHAVWTKRLKIHTDEMIFDELLKKSESKNVVWLLKELSGQGSQFANH